MKKKLLGLAIALFAAGTISSFAANTNDKKCDKQDCPKQQQCDKKDGECKKDRQCPNPFEGLNLTADQQAKLKELKGAGCCKERKDGKANKDNRVAPRQAKRDFLAKVKGILTPEQYVTFLENNFANARPHMDKAHRHGSKHGDKKGMKGQRPEKRQSSKDKK